MRNMHATYDLFALHKMEWMIYIQIIGRAR